MSPDSLGVGERVGNSLVAVPYNLGRFRSRSQGCYGKARRGQCLGAQSGKLGLRFDGPGPVGDDGVDVELIQGNGSLRRAPGPNLVAGVLLQFRCCGGCNSSPVANHRIGRGVCALIGLRLVNRVGCRAGHVVRPGKHHVIPNPAGIEVVDVIQRGVGQCLGRFGCLGGLGVIGGSCRTVADELRRYRNAVVSAEQGEGYRLLPGEEPPVFGLRAVVELPDYLGLPGCIGHGVSQVGLSVQRYQELIATAGDDLLRTDIHRRVGKVDGKGTARGHIGRGLNLGLPAQNHRVSHGLVDAV